MNIIQIVRLLYRNAFLLIASGLVMALAVYLFLLNAPRTYESNTTIYTGIGSGMNLEGTGSAGDFFGTNMAYDNLLNIISSRETLEEVSLRLFAKHLLLEKADPKYISQTNYDKLMSIIPDDVFDLVVRRESIENKKNIEEKEEIKETKSYKKEPSKQKTVKNIYHIVQPDETLYSISRKYNIPLIKLMRLNDMSDNLIRAGDKLIINLSEKSEDKSIEDESKQFDKDGNIFYIPQYDENIESIALKFNISSSDLIIWNSLQERTVKSGTNLIVGKKGEYEVVDSDNPSSDDLMASDIENTDQLLIREDVGQSSLEKRLNEEFDDSYELEETLKNFYAYKEKNDTNFIYGLLNYNIAHYSVIALQKIGVKRLESSDIVQLSYKTNDPGICQYTLVLLSNVFIKNYKLIKENQSDKVVKYFQEEVNNANERLQSAEDELLRFNKDNNIINYYEQTKYIAAEKENLDRDYQDEKMNLAASKAAYEKLESKLATQPGIKFNREDILNKTKEISILTEKITFLETEPEPNESTQNEIRRLNQQLTKLKSEIRRIVDYEFTSSSSIEGIPVQEVLTQWLEAIIAYEESEARLNVYSERKAGVERTYTTFAPLGAKLKRIEREIEVSEKEYLSLLNSLNSSKLKQQNIELSSNIKPVGFPFYPITPKTQLKKFLMPGAAILGFILCFLILILLELLDRNINNPKTALTHTSMQTVSAFPFIPRKFRKIDFPFIIKKLSEQIIQHIKLLSSKIIGRPIIVGITSTRNNEGKTRIVTELVQQIRESGDKVLFINHSNDLDGKIDEDTYCYKLNHKYSDVKDYKELCPEIDSFSKYRYIFIELPSLIYNVYPFELVSKLDTTYIVCQAKRVWSSADQKVYQNLKGSLNHEAFLILNNAKLDVVEYFISEIPKKRSRFRKFMKHLLSSNDK